jgi:electron transport complex protein RnfD
MREKDTALALKPQVNLARSTAARMWLVCICAFLAVIQSALTDGFRSLLLAFCVLVSSLLTELIITWRNSRFRCLFDGSAAASALVFVLLLPNQMPFIYAILGAVFAMAVVKHSFGGLGSYWLNPALGGWLFLRFTWPGIFSEALEGSPLAVIASAVSGGISNPQGSPLGLLRISGSGSSAFVSSSFDGAVSSLLNATIFSFTRAELASGYVDLFISALTGIIADRGLFALIIGTILITSAQVNRAWIPALYLLVYGFLIRIFGALPFGGVIGGGDILFGFFSGGTIASAFLLAAEPVTGAKSIAGLVTASLAAAVFSWVFRYLGNEPYGAFLAAGFVNALGPLIRSIEVHSFYSVKRRRAR